MNKNLNRATKVVGVALGLGAGILTGKYLSETFEMNGKANITHSTESYKTKLIEMLNENFSTQYEIPVDYQKQMADLNTLEGKTMDSINQLVEQANAVTSLEELASLSATAKDVEESLMSQMQQEDIDTKWLTDFFLHFQQSLSSLQLSMEYQLLNATDSLATDTVSVNQI